MSNLFVMIGGPGSGKSTFLRALKDSYPSAVVLSSDDYIEAKAKEENSTYGEVFDKYYKEAEQNIQTELKKAIVDKETVIWDQTNLSIKKRKKILSHFTSDWNKYAIWVKTPLDVALERVRLRGEETGKKIPTGIVVSMHQSIETPSSEEGFDQIIVVDGTAKTEWLGLS